METTPAKRAGCDSTTSAQKNLAREIVGQFAGKWSLWTLHVLTDSGGPLRFARLHERIEGISQKMLTQTLRQLERDGLVTRTVFPEVPPRVEYALTEKGRALEPLIDDMRSYGETWLGVGDAVAAGRETVPA